MLNKQGRQTQPDLSSQSQNFINRNQTTHSGHRGLHMDEPLLFEIGSLDKTGVDFSADIELLGKTDTGDHLGDLKRCGEIGLPGLCEPEAMRHYVRLSQNNYSIDGGFYPLGSCTMKHNPRLNEKMARLPGFSDIHPLQPLSSVQGALELMDELSRWLLEMTGMSAVALSPKAGAHGELCGMMAIKAALRAQGSDHDIVLVPESAHGTNPATAALLGFKVCSIPAHSDGTVRVEAVRQAIDKAGADKIAAIMLTNPNTCGLFEREIIEIAQLIHDAGGYFYCDGANFNAIVGKVYPGDLGIDAMHINLHKTFSTPHGGGGPGSGPVVLSDKLSPYAPLPYVVQEGRDFHLVEHKKDARDNRPFGRLTAFHGQMGMYVRALSYMLSHGGDGLRQSSEDAVLNANYLRARLRDVLTQPFGDQVCMHEVLFDDSSLKDSGVSTLDFAKALIDEGFHPMTIYFPLVARGAMLVEPTESESKRTLDQFIDVVRALMADIQAGDTDKFHAGPVHTPRRRLDETGAARVPILRWEQTDRGK